jgi:hypothetical protein
VRQHSDGLERGKQAEQQRQDQAGVRVVIPNPLLVILSEAKDYVDAGASRST